MNNLYTGAEAFDGFLIHKLFEPLAHVVQKYLGATNFFLAKCCIWIALVIHFWNVLLVAADQSLFLRSALLVIYVAWGIWLLMDVASIERREKQWLADQENNVQYRNSEEVHGFRTRIILVLSTAIQIVWVLQTLTGTVAWLLFGTYMLLLCSLYFLACTPLPPAQALHGTAAQQA